MLILIIHQALCLMHLLFYSYVSLTLYNILPYQTTISYKTLIDTLKQSHSRRTAQLASDILLDGYIKCLDGLGATENVKGMILDQLNAMED